MKQLWRPRQNHRRKSPAFRLIFILTVLAATSFSTHLSCEEWENYYRVPRQIYGLAIEESGSPEDYGHFVYIPEVCDYYVWCATEVGVFRLDPCSGDYIRYSYADGLIHNSTKVITIDDAGDKWIGTTRSTDTGWMSRFDGETWTTYTPPGPSIVNAITIDDAGHVWVGRGDFFSTMFGYGGINVFDGSDWIVYHTGNSGLVTDYVEAITVDAAGDKWIGACTVPLWFFPPKQPGGVNHFDGATWTTYDLNNSDLTGEYVYDIAIDSQQNKWVATFYRGIYMYDNENWFNYTVDDGLPSDTIQTIAADDEDSIWFGTVLEGAGMYDGVDLYVFNTDNSGLVNNNVHDIAIYQPEGSSADDREVWFATGDGVCLLTGLGWTNYSLGGIFDTIYKDVHVDDAGTVWFATSDGVVAYDGNNWTGYHTGNSELSSDNVQALAADGDGHVWVGTDAGLNRFDGFNWTLYDTVNSDLASNNVRALAVDGDGHVWAGTDAGLNHFDGMDWITYHVGNSGLASDNVRALVLDGTGSAWIGTDAGLNHFDGMEWVVFNIDNSELSSNHVRALAPDGTGCVWVGTDAGLNHFDGNSWTAYNIDNSDLPNNVIRAVDVDGYNRTWIATNGEMGRFDGVDWKVYQSGDGLGNRVVSGIFADDTSDSVWFAVGSGASRMTPAVADGNGSSGTTGSAGAFTPETGMLDISCFIRTIKG